MTIPESKLQAWASAPSPTEMARIKRTHEAVERELRRHLPIDDLKRKYNLGAFDCDIFLQGSYANSTNIRFESDVDIVVQLNTVFFSDKSQLSDIERTLHDSTYPDVNYPFLEFKQQVFDALRAAFGTQDVEYDDNCIKVKDNPNRTKADVVPCFQYKVYKRFISHDNQHFVGGIKFLNTESKEWVFNFPKVHLVNCESKNVDTDGVFKSVIRIFKNMKVDLIEHGKLTEETARNYYIENLLYNCSSPCFDGSYSDCMLNTLQFLFDALKMNRAIGFICANEQDSLFSHKTWNLVDAEKFVLAIADYYLHPENL